MTGVLIGVLIFAGFVFLIVGVISVFSPQPSVGISTRIRAVAVLFAAIAMMVLAAVLAANNPEFTHDLEARKKELQQQAQRRLRDNLKRQEERTQARVSSAKTPSEKLVDQPVYDPPQKGPVAPSGAPQAPQGIRAEVIEYVTRPCAEATVRRGLRKYGATVEEQEALFDLTVHVALQAHETHESIDAVVAVAVKMPSRAARLAFYELSRQICIDSGRQTGQAGGGSRRARAPVPQQQSPARPLRVPAESSLPRDRLARALYFRGEIMRYVVGPCAMWLTQLQAPLKPHVPVDVLTKINEQEAYSLFGDLSVLIAVADGMETRAARLGFYEEEKRSCIERLARRRDDRIRQQGERSAPTKRARPYAPPKPARPSAEPRW